MASKYWIKLYHEMLHDRKVASLDDHLWRRTVELFLLAGEQNDEGVLPPLQDMTWLLRTSEEELETDLNELIRVGIIEFLDGRYMVRKFSERQAPLNKAEYMKRLRDNKQKERYQPVTNSNADKESDTEKEEIRESTSNIPFSDSETAKTHTTLLDHNSQNVAELYTLVTGQIQPLSKNIDKAFHDLKLVLDHYNTVEDAVPPGKHIYGMWCQKRGKTGKTYSPLNIAWIEKWLENLARDTEQANTAKEKEQIYKNKTSSSLNKLANKFRL